MFFLSPKKSSAPEGGERFASAAEIEFAFGAQQDFLFWLALMIAGNDEVAQKCIIGASGLSQQGAGVFRDWLDEWARSATVRFAIGEARDQIAEAVHSYDGLSCPHGGHPTLSPEDVRALRTTDAQILLAGLDPLARAVLVLRGVRKAAIQDCALSLDVSRGTILAAYCRATEGLLQPPAELSTAQVFPFGTDAGQ